MRTVERPLVVGVDGSEPSLHALDWAVEEAVRRGTELRIVHGSTWGWYEGHGPSFGIDRTHVRQYAEHIAAQAVERAQRLAGAVKVTGQVLPQDPALALTQESREACAVVVGSRGRGEAAELLLGSVSLSVAAHAEVPVIVVRGAEKSRTGGHKRVVLGIDEADGSAPVVDFAFAAAARRGAAVRAVHAWRCPAHELPDFPQGAEIFEPHRRRAEALLGKSLRQHLETHRALVVRRDAIEGKPRSVLLNAAQTADLLVVGARRRNGHVGMQLGPVNHAVLHHSACPVAVVPHD
ncbi:universal stress protein [Streptomyces sp. TRM66268-LWL]|uniref:Universal stress protein n=1 Tax=Streptomyces polyasparticus TaxID=2767826 RepID=A0ABR7SNI9_9ACTN|nr:universal stress protein [Streptomyces polyasparticus]MBC9715913.1 universal stress protein [Streptomyces polyasparticus]